ncbi:O-antigen ligase family protein [Microbacterium sp. CFH 90308]|uniref:O-antigen ligase family protein n=1 Tax=Microbacterium salsuginis TaxID=2722803 RepID=A0ABX1KBC2_9MICO|nr:O-antigen ligase family protein [Microbacterium sp. CFH 90308]NLP84328.1 O-antigen ligase family protein [Microbacterium sp. CFH 90308]
MIAYICLGIAVALFFIVWHRAGGAAASFVVVVSAVCLPVIDLLTFGQATANTAIAAPTITLATYQLALLGGLLALPVQTVRNVPVLYWMFLAFVGVLAVAQGQTDAHTLSGVLHWGAAVLAWGVGAAVAQSAAQSGLPTERFIAIVAAFIVGWHALFVVLQLAGVRAVGTVEAGITELARVSGAAGHSGNLGKIMLLLVMILLPVTRSDDKAARRWAVVTVSSAAVLTALTFSRANTVAIGILIGTWLVLGPGIRFSKRVAVILVAIIVAIPIVDILILRSQYDPDGGSRPRLMAAAIEQISQTLWLGVGPNNYLEVVGRFDSLAAGGLPVHSAFLLALAELGLICCILLGIPLILLMTQSLRNLPGSSPAKSYAIALVAATPGILIVAGTGWGILRGQFLVLLFFALGYMGAAQKYRRLHFETFAHRTANRLVANG